MSTFSFETGPLLVSDLPPVAVPSPTLFARAVEAVRRSLAARRDSRGFERALRFAGPNEAADLFAQRRRA